MSFKKTEIISSNSKRIRGWLENYKWRSDFWEQFLICINYDHSQKPWNLFLTKMSWLYSSLEEAHWLGRDDCTDICRFLENRTEIENIKIIVLNRVRDLFWYIQWHERLRAWVDPQWAEPRDCCPTSGWIWSWGSLDYQGTEAGQSVGCPADEALSVQSVLRSPEEHPPTHCLWGPRFANFSCSLSLDWDVQTHCHSDKVPWLRNPSI